MLSHGRATSADNGDVPRRTARVGSRPLLPRGIWPGQVQGSILASPFPFCSMRGAAHPKSGSALAPSAAGEAGGWCHQPAAPERCWSWRNCLDLLALLPSHGHSQPGRTGDASFSPLHPSASLRATARTLALLNHTNWNHLPMSMGRGGQG